MTSTDQPEIDDFASHLFRVTRGLGMEQGTGLLLQLLYLRWAAHEPNGSVDASETTWTKLRDDVAHGVVRPDTQIRAMLGERLRPWVEHVTLPPDDGGRTIEVLIGQLDRWPFDVYDGAAVRRVASRLFEAVLRLRSERLSRAGGEHETPPSLARLIAEAVVRPGDRVIDPACGIGTTLMAAGDLHPAALTGRDVNDALTLQARMRFELAGQSVALERRDMLAGLHSSERYDAVVLHPPFGQKIGHEVHQAALDNLPLGTGASRSADFLWIELAQAMTNPGGRAAVLSPARTLLGAGRDAAVRGALLRAGLVEAVISLPPNMLAGTSIPGALWLLRGSADNIAKDRILLVNGAAVEHATDARRVSLTDTGLQTLLDVIRQWRTGPAGLDVPGHLARGVALGQLDEHSALVPTRFLGLVPEQDPPRPTPPRKLLTQLRVSNLKSFGQDTEIDLAPLTLVYGPNSSGKSSVLQSLLLLKQSLSSDTLVTQGELTDAGSFEGLVHRHDTQLTVQLGVTFGSLERWSVPDGIPSPAFLRSVDLAFRSDGADLPRHHHARFRFGDLDLAFGRTHHQRAPDASPPFTLSTDAAGPAVEAVADGAIAFPVRVRREADNDRRRANRANNARRALRALERAGVDQLEIEADGLLPSSRVDLDRVKAYFGGADNGFEKSLVDAYVIQAMRLAAGTGSELRHLLKDLRYLGPLRSAPQRFYNRAAAAAGAGTSGEHIALHLFDNASELDEVNDWLEALQLPYSLSVVPVRTTGGTAIIGDNVAIVLQDTRSGIEVSPADVGFGVSQVLPIVVQLLATQDSVICIEQPEIHIHPKLQTELAELMILSVSEAGRNNQLIVETHSEHLLMRLQRRMRERTLSPDDVAVLYVDPDENGTARVRRLRLDDQGYFLDPWPAGFFDDGLDELFGGLA